MMRAKNIYQPFIAAIFVPKIRGFLKYRSETILLVICVNFQSNVMFPND